MWYNMPMRWNHWVLIGLGTWLLLSPWILGFSELNLPVWNVIFAGSLVIIFSLWESSPKE